MGGKGIGKRDPVFHVLTSQPAKDHREYDNITQGKQEEFKQAINTDLDSNNSLLVLVYFSE